MIYKNHKKLEPTCKDYAHRVLLAYGTTLWCLVTITCSCTSAGTFFTFLHNQTNLLTCALMHSMSNELLHHIAYTA